jgi:hypothetical protein
MANYNVVFRYTKKSGDLYGFLIAQPFASREVFQDYERMLSVDSKALREVFVQGVSDDEAKRLDGAKQPPTIDFAPRVQDAQVS